jgi:hypothetical protein
VFVIDDDDERETWCTYVAEVALFATFVATLRIEESPCFRKLCRS